MRDSVNTDVELEEAKVTSYRFLHTNYLFQNVGRSTKTLLIWFLNCQQHAKSDVKDQILAIFRKLYQINQTYLGTK